MAILSTSLVFHFLLCPQGMGVIDNDLFIQIYGNKLKNKLNLALVFKNRRLYGFDSEGGIYHCHPLDDPDTHDFVDEKKSIHDFVMESMEFLEQKELL